MITCQWFALCTNEATLTVTHPVMGSVPCCQRCCDKLDMADRATPLADAPALAPHADDCQTCGHSRTSHTWEYARNRAVQIVAHCGHSPCGCGEYSTRAESARTYGPTGTVFRTFGDPVEPTDPTE